MSRQRRLSREASTQSIVFHSRVDNTNNYIRILEGLRALAIERSTFHVDQVLSDINSGGGGTLQAALSLAGMVPGRLGKTAQGLRVLDLGRSTVESYKKLYSTDDANFLVETQVRGIIQDILNATEGDPELLEKINGYLPSQFGKLGADAADIINASTLLSDHHKLRMIEALGSDNAQTLQVFYDTLADKESELAQRIQQRITDLEYEKAIREAEEFSVYGSLVSQIVSLNDAKAGRKIGIIVSSLTQVSKISAKIAAEKMSASLATANYLSIGLSVYSAMQGEEEDGVAKGLAMLQKLIIQCTEAILDRLDQLDSRLLQLQRQVGNLYDAVLAQSEDIDALHRKIDELENLAINRTNFILSGIRDGFFRDLDAVAVRAMAHKDIHQPGNFEMAREDFFEIVQTLYAFASVHSTDQLSTAVSPADFEEPRLLDTLSLAEFGTSARVLSFALSRYSGGLFPTAAVDIRMWVLATNVLLELIGDWPEYQEGMAIDFLKEAREVIVPVERLLRACSLQNSRDFYVEILERAKTERSQYYDSIEIAVGNFFVDEMKRNTNYSPRPRRDIDWGSLSKETFYDYFDKMDFDFDRFTIQSHFDYNKMSRRDHSLEAPDWVLPYIPVEAYIAQWFGGRLSGHFEFKARKVPPSRVQPRVQHQPNRVINVEVVGTFDVEFKPPGADEAKKYRIARRQIGPLQAFIVAPITPEQYIKFYVRRCFSPAEDLPAYANLKEGSAKVDADLTQLRSDLEPMVQSLLFRIQDKVTTHAKNDMAINADRKAADGLEQLIWRALMSGESDSVLRQFEQYFLNMEEDFTQSDLFLKKSLNETRTRLNSEVDTVSSKLMSATSNPSAESAFPYVARVAKRLDSCIQTLERGNRWYTEYGSSRIVVRMNTD